MKIKGMQVRGSPFHFLFLFVHKQGTEYLHVCVCVCTFVCIRISFLPFSRSFLFTDFDIIYHPLLSFIFSISVLLNLLLSSFRSRRFFGAHRLSLSLSFSRSQSFSVIPLPFGPSLSLTHLLPPLSMFVT